MILLVYSAFLGEAGAALGDLGAFGAFLAGDLDATDLTGTAGLWCQGEKKGRVGIGKKRNLLKSIRVISQNSGCQGRLRCAKGKGKHRERFFNTKEKAREGRRLGVKWLELRNAIACALSLLINGWR